jgi:tRNA(Ile)-lysidine synthase
MSKELSRSTFLKRVKDTIKQYDMLRKGDRVLVAVSGGPDSVCLLRALLDIRREMDIEVFVGNLDHSIRGKESKKDSDFVIALSRENGLDVVHERINVKTSAKTKKSLEERAREKRYNFLIKAAKKKKCNIVATGHTLDDQAETVLMRIISGTSAAGLTGIPPARCEGDIKFIRPFIRVKKKDILDYLKKVRWKYVQDRTNLDTRIRRNKIRLEVLPFLEKVNPMIKRALSNLADTLREDHDSLRIEEKKVSGLYIKEQKGTIKINLVDLILQPRSLRKALFKESVKRAGGNIKKLTHRHWVDMDYFVRSSEKGKSLDFPGNIRATKTGTELVFKKR